jgi:hypothetical protein
MKIRRPLPPYHKRTPQEKKEGIRIATSGPPSEGHLLMSDLSHRDPINDLEDIDTGQFLQTLSELPTSLRQLMEDGDVHVKLAFWGGRYRIVKIIAKRNPEFKRGSKKHFIFDKESKRIPVSEEKLDEIIGLGGDPEDVYNNKEVEFGGLQEEHIPPMDAWDVCYDATDYLRRLEQLQENDELTPLLQREGIEAIDKMQDELIYSAKWFPTPVMKGLHSARARAIAKRIESGLTRQEMRRLLQSPADSTKEVVKVARLKARKMRPCREKGQILLGAIKILAIKAEATKQKKYPPAPLAQSEKAKLWGLWREAEMRRGGSVKLTSWQFRKALRAKLLREGHVDPESIEAYVQERVNAIYPRRAKEFGQYQEPVLDPSSLPEWLEGASDEQG